MTWKTITVQDEIQPDTTEEYKHTVDKDSIIKAVEINTFLGQQFDLGNEVYVITNDGTRKDVIDPLQSTAPLNNGIGGNDTNYNIATDIPLEEDGEIVVKTKNRDTNNTYTADISVHYIRGD